MSARFSTQRHLFRRLFEKSVISHDFFHVRAASSKFETGKLVRSQVARHLEVDWHHSGRRTSIAQAAGPPHMLGTEPFAGVKLYRQLDPEIRSLWKTLAENAIHTPYQDLEWYEAWLATVGKIKAEEPFIVAVFDSLGAPTVLVPLVLIRRKSIAMAKFPGGRHANYNFPLVRRDVDITPLRLQFLSDELADLGADIDLYWFDALPMQWLNKPNPLLIAPHHRDAAVSSVIDLRKVGSHSCGLSFRHRSSYRKLQKLGATVQRACSESDVATVLETFFLQKSAWFRARSLPDSFRQHGIADFFLRLFSERTSGELYALRLNGDTLAVAGVAVSAERASLMFISYDLNHRLVKLGPGTHLVRSLIEQMSQRNIAQFDFGLGDAEYKRLLGASMEPAFVSVQAITGKGRAIACLLVLTRAMKGYIKGSSRIFSATQRLRRLVQKRRSAQGTSF